MDFSASFVFRQGTLRFVAGEKGAPIHRCIPRSKMRNHPGRPALRKFGFLRLRTSRMVSWPLRALLMEVAGTRRGCRRNAISVTKAANNKTLNVGAFKLGCITQNIGRRLSAHDWPRTTSRREAKPGSPGRFPWCVGKVSKMCGNRTVLSGFIPTQYRWERARAIRRARGTTTHDRGIVESRPKFGWFQMRDAAAAGQRARSARGSQPRFKCPVRFVPDQPYRPRPSSRNPNVFISMFSLIQAPQTSGIEITTMVILRIENFFWGA